MDRAPQHPVRTDELHQVEPAPEHHGEFVLRPISLSMDELMGLPVTVPDEPRAVLAWIRFPAIAQRVHGRALAWTPKAVYLEWEDRGIHRCWVWANAVEHAPAEETAVPVQSIQPAEEAQPAEQKHTHAFTAMDTRPLVELARVQLMKIGADFHTAMAKPAGPFGAMVFGSIDGHSVRMDLNVEPTTRLCGIHVVDPRSKELLAERVAAPSFEDAIEQYSWDDVLEAISLYDD
jgi:hypothetical protein